MLKPAAAFLIAVSVAPSIAQAECPVINGTFQFVYKREGGQDYFYQVEIYTRQERDRFSYTWDTKTSIIADGKFYPIRVGEQEGELRHACEDGTLLRELRRKGSDKIWWKRFKVLNRMEIEITGNYPGKSGIYQKQL